MKISVGVFEMQKKKSVYVYAYTRDFNSAWSGCCIHTVEVENKKDAKKKAIEDHRNKCMNKQGRAVNVILTEDKING